MPYTPRPYHIQVQISASSSAPTTSMERQKNPHIVAMPYPGQGHINPMMHLARRLASHGFSITFVLPRRYHSANVIQNGGASTDGSIKLEAIRDDMLPERTMANVPQFVKSTDKLREPFQELLGRIVDEKKKIACVISDMFLPWTQDVANLFQIPRVAFFPFPAATALVFLHLPQLTEAGYAPMIKQDIGEDEVIEFIPGLRRIHPSDVPFCIQKEDPDLRIMHRMERVQDAAWTLVNTFDELEGSEVESIQTQVKNFVPVGPLLPSSYFGASKDHEQIRAVAAPAWIQDERCVKWLNKQERLSVLYLSFGSITNMTIEQLHRVEAGIRASGYRFLWVLRPNIAEGSTLQEFEAFLKDLIARNNEQQGMVVQWAPQLDVLRHRSVGAFLTHCGWNSTLESICAGVPMLGWPCFAEQNTNCKYMADVWKVGLRLEKTAEGIVSEEEIETKVRCVMEGEEGKEMRKRVRKLGDAGRKTVEEGSSHSNLVAFATAMGL